MSVEDFAAGWIGGLTVLAVCHPLDTIKVQLQSSLATNVVYRNGLDCALRIYSQEGLYGFYKGIAAPMAGIGVSYAALFGVYGGLKRYIAVDSNTELKGHLQNACESSALENALCATCGGVAQSVTMTPFEVIRIRLQTQTLFAHRKYDGVLHCAKQVYADGGIPKLFLGLRATILRDVPSAVIYFGSYGVLRRMLPQTQDSWNIPSTLFAGGIAGVAQWLVAFPLDTVKTHIQTAKKDMYHGWHHAVAELFRNGGLPAFYTGLGPALIRAFVANACCFCGIEVFLECLRLSKQTKKISAKRM